MTVNKKWREKTLTIIRPIESRREHPRPEVIEAHTRPIICDICDHNLYKTHLGTPTRELYDKGKRFTQLQHKRFDWVRIRVGFELGVRGKVQVVGFEW